MCSVGKSLVRLNTLLGTNRIKIKGHTDPEKTPPATLIQTPRQAEPLQSVPWLPDTGLSQCRPCKPRYRNGSNTTRCLPPLSRQLLLTANTTILVLCFISHNFCMSIHFSVSFSTGIYILGFFFIRNEQLKIVLRFWQVHKAGFEGMLLR